MSKQVVVTGSKGCGKTSLVNHLSDGNLEFNDVAAASKASKQGAFGNSDAILLCYDVTDKKSFESAKKEVDLAQTSVKKYGHGKHIPITLVGLKTDLADNRAVPQNEAKLFADKKGVAFNEASASTNAGIAELKQVITTPIAQAPTQPTKESGVRGFLRKASGKKAGGTPVVRVENTEEQAHQPSAPKQPDVARLYPPVHSPNPSPYLGHAPELYATLIPDPVQNFSPSAPPQTIVSVGQPGNFGPAYAPHAAFGNPIPNPSPAPSAPPMSVTLTQSNVPNNTRQGGLPSDPTQPPEEIIHKIGKPTKFSHIQPDPTRPPHIAGGSGSKFQDLFQEAPEGFVIRPGQNQTPLERLKQEQREISQKHLEQLNRSVAPGLLVQLQLRNNILFSSPLFSLKEVDGGLNLVATAAILDRKGLGVAMIGVGDYINLRTGVQATPGFGNNDTCTFTLPLKALQQSQKWQKEVPASIKQPGT